MKLVKARRLRQPERSKQAMTRARRCVAISPAQLAPAATVKRSPRPLTVEDVEPVALERYGAVLPQYSAPAALGEHLRIQAARGYRAGVIALRPGLYLVAELPAEAITPEFGLVPVLAPLVVRAALKALDNPESTRQNMQAFSQLVRRPQPPASPVPWADAEDWDEAYEGIAGCSGGCTRCGRGHLQ